ncbi:MAG: hypothetical protein KA201_14130 [Kofleriaceae bacterium]|nr:hypothetical protein [Kofleriaceae bacterium]
MAGWLRLTLPLCIALLAGCYERRLDACMVTCAGACPDGLTCGGDGYCHLPGEPATCGAIDAAPPDGGPDGGDPDAALVDAALDGAPVDGGDPDGPDGGFVPGGVTAIVAGAAHTCAIDDQAQLWCWGQNVHGEVGDGSGQPRVPTPTMIATGVTQVAAGGDHACAIAGGRVRCWGQNLDGQSGQPTVGVVATPTEVTGSGAGWIAVAVGARHSCGIKQVAAAEQRVYCWGADAHGARGDGAAANVGPTPTEVSGGQTTWTALVAAGDHTCGIVGGRAQCWGDNGQGQLGVGDRLDRDAPTAVVAGDNPSRQYAQLAANAGTTCGVHSGALVCWGDNRQRLYGDATASATAPHQVASGAWTAVALGDTSGCGLRGGAPVCWGAGGRGQIGDGARADRLAATAVGGLATATTVTVGGAHACAISGTQAWCWGDNASGQLGDGTRSALFAPTAVTATTGWIDVAAADGHTCARRAGAGRTELWCWGRNDARQVDPGSAIGAVLDRPTELMATRDWGEVAAGRRHTCAIERVGAARALWCWGDNARGQLGTGAPAGVQPPATIATPSLTTWGALVADGDAACAIAEGTRYCWGRNDRGQLGLADLADRDRPTAGAATWRAVALGATFGCGRDAQDQLWCWGSDDRGELGLGAGDQATATPQQVTPGPVTALGAGAAHACATSAATPVCWGDNREGQTGHAAAVASIDAPTTVVGTSAWSAVVGGRAHGCALTASGRLACWGSDERGQIAQPGGQSSAAPILIGSATWTALAAGAEHACGISGGGLYCWGDNAVGQLGVGDVARATPVAPLIP